MLSLITRILLIVLLAVTMAGCAAAIAALNIVSSSALGSIEFAHTP